MKKLQTTLKNFLLPALAAFISLSLPLSAEEKAELGVDEIVKRANRVSYYQGRDGKAEVTMTISDADGKTRERRFVVLRRDEETDDKDTATGEQKFFIYFKRPPDWNRTVYIVHKHLDRDDDRWLYLPGLDNVNRIAASDKRTSFVGSNFFYEDISGRNLTEDTHELVNTTDQYFIVKNTPKKPEEVEFSYYQVYIHKTTFLPVSAEYFDKEGNKYRTMLARKTEMIDGYLTVTEAVMSDLKNGGSTKVEYSRVKYNNDLPEEIFTERYLRNPPRQYLR